MNPLSPGCGLALRAKNTGKVLFAFVIAAFTASFCGETLVRFCAKAATCAANSKKAPTARCWISLVIPRLLGIECTSLRAPGFLKIELGFAVGRITERAAVAAASRRPAAAHP